MAIVDTAESAVADAGRRECYLLCKEVKALLPRSQGFRLEFGGFKLSVFPECKAKWPPGAKSGRGWRRPGAATASTKASKHKPRAAKHEAASAEAALPATLTSTTKEQPETSRQRRSAKRAAGRAAAALAASLPPPPLSEPDAEAEVPTATALPPPGLDGASTKRRLSFLAAASFSKRVAVDSHSSSSSSPGPALALEVGSEDMYLPSIPHQNEPLPSPIITNNEHHIRTRPRSKRKVRIYFLFGRDVCDGEHSKAQAHKTLAPVR